MTERIVFIYLPGEFAAAPAGRLTMIEAGVEVLASRFAYGRRYRARANALEVDPVSLPLRADAELVPAQGLALFGALRDATPDAWGRRVIENYLRAPPNGLPESVYLDHAGPYRAGALDVRSTPTSIAGSGALPALMDLEYLLEASARIEQGEQVPSRLAEFFAGGPSLGGARPKALLMAEGHEWIAKFPARGDPFDVPLIEFATLELARSTGLQVPATQLHQLADGRHALLIQRFDRVWSTLGSSRRHMVSALTLLAKHESASPDCSYADIVDGLNAHGVAGAIAGDRRELYARMVFNILVSNDDDHLRNHAFLYDPPGAGWRLSPLYDVVPKPQLGSDRTLHLAVGPQGRAARLDNALAGAGRFGLAPNAAAKLIDQVVNSVRAWRESFETSGVPVSQCDRVATAFRRAQDVGFAAVARSL